MPLNLAPFDSLVQGGDSTYHTECLCRLHDGTAHQLEGMWAIFPCSLSGDL